MKMPVWTESDIALLREQYAKGDITALCAQLGRTLTSVYVMAGKLKLFRGQSGKRPPRLAGPEIEQIRAAILQAARQAAGVRMHELCISHGFNRSNVDRVKSSLYKAGLLHPARITHRNVRYHATAEAASAMNRPAPKKPSLPALASPAIVINARSARGPAYLPGEPVITSNTRVTIAPPPPARVYRSNTFLMAG